MWWWWWCGGGCGGGDGGGFHCIMWSPQLRFVLELGCDNTYLLRLDGIVTIDLIVHASEMVVQYPCNF